MDDLDAIKQLKARYFRCMDTKDCYGFREVFSPDCTYDVTDGGTYANRADFLEMLLPTLADVVTVHHGHMPEITFTSDDEATGIWAMEDRLQFPAGSGIGELHGFGHYHETYRRTEAGWQISSLRLTRLRMDHTPEAAPD